MSEIEDRVRDSAVISNLSEALALLTGLEAQDWVVEEASDLVSRLTSVVRNLRVRLTLCDPNLIPRNTLDELDSPTQDILDIVRHLKDSAPFFDLNVSNVHNQMDDLLVVAMALPEIGFTPDDMTVEKAVEQLNLESMSAIATISGEAETLRSEITELRREINQTVANSSSSLNELGELLNQRVAEAQNTTESLLARIDEATERLQREVTSIQETFRQSQSQRYTEFTEAQSQRIDEFNEAQETRDREFHEGLDSTIEDIVNFRDQANKMLEEVAGASSAEHYAKQRDSQKKNADLWRWIGVGALFVLAVMSGYIFLDTRSDDVDFSATWLVARSGILVSLGVFAGYAFRQSGQHRRREEAVDRVANELMLLWPFISRLPNEDREMLLREITPLYFKGGLSGGDSSEQANVAERIRSAITQRGRNKADD